MSHVENEIEGMPEAIRYDRFLAAWEAHKKSGFEATQENLDRIAAMWKVKAPKLAEDLAAKIAQEFNTGLNRPRRRPM